MSRAADTGSEALQLYRKSAATAKQQGDPRLVDAMLKTLRVLHSAQTAVLPLHFTGEFDPDLSHWNQSPVRSRTGAQAISDPDIAGLGPGAGIYARDELRSALRAAVGAAAIDLNELGPDDEASGAPVHLTLAYRIFKGQRTYQNEGKRKSTYRELDVDWTLTFRWPGEPEPGMREVSVTVHTAPSPTFNTFTGSADIVYASMLAEDAKSLGPALRRALGLVPPAVEAPE